MTTLYRKYRPQAFSDLTGQEHILQTVMNEIATEKIAHAYLFSGPRGVGKTTLARLLAKAVNCPNRKAGTSEPCGTCSSCQEITTGKNIDVIEIDAASHTGVDNVRENIIENAQFKPTKSPFKVFIVDEVHMLSTSAFNALLKTLEEPPAHVIFVLATTELHKLPATVISRCQRFNFKKIPYELMRDRLKKICGEEKVKVAKEVLERIIAKSDGCLRDAESLLGQILSLGGKEITVSTAELVLPSPAHETVLGFLENIIGGNTRGALKIISNLPEQGVNLDQFAFDTIEMLRSLLILQATGEAIEMHSDYSEEILKRLKKLSATITPIALTRLIDRALARRLEIKTAPLPQLPLELLAVECSSPSRQESTAEKALPGKAGEELPTDELPRATIIRSEPTVEAPITLTPIAVATTDVAATTPSSHGLKATIKNALAHLAHETPLTTTFEQIKSKWREVIIKISETNASLTFVLTGCTLKKLNHTTLELTVPFGIHRDKIEEHKNKQIIHDALQAVFGEKIRCTCTVVTEEKIAEVDLNNLALEFGGEIVN